MATQTSSSAGTERTAGPILDPFAWPETFAEVCNSRDVERMVAYFEPDAIIVERTGELTRGAAAIRKHIEQLLSLKPMMEIRASRTVVNGDLAHNSTWWHCDATAPDGSSLQLECQASASVLRRRPEGSWLVVIDNPWGAQV